MKTPRLTAWILLIGALATPTLPAATITWNNTGTDFNAGASWTGGTSPGSADNATFNAAATTQPALSSAVTVQGLTFQGVSGYTLSSSGAAITLTNTGASGTSPQSINATNTSGTNTISSNIILGGAAAATHGLTQNGGSGSTLVLSGNISSTNNISALGMRGTGTITLSGNNTYSGNTTLNGNTLNINSATAISSGALAVAAASSIDNTSGSAITLTNNNNISLNNNLTFIGTNNLSFGSGTLNVLSNRTLTTTSGTLTIGSIGANATTNVLTKQGTGTLVINNAAGANFQGGFLLTTGTVLAGHKNALGTGTITTSTASYLGSNAALTGSDAMNNNITLNGTNFYIVGENALTLSGNITNSGGNRNINGSNSAATELSGNIFLSEASGTGRTLTLRGSSNFTISGTIANFNGGAGTAGNIVKSETNTVTLSGSASTYSGTTTVSAGTLAVAKLANGGTASSIGASSSAASNLLLANGAVLQYVGTGDSTDRLFTLNVSTGGHGAVIDSSGTGAVVFSNTGSLAYGTADQNRVLTFRGSNLDLNTFAARLENNGTGATSIVKSDGGTWLLTGNNSYSGSTTINGGILRFNNSDSFGAGALSLRGGVIGLGFGDLTRPLAAGSGNITIENDGSGFAAYGANRTVNSGGAGTLLIWGGSNFFSSGGSNFVLNVDSSDATLNFANNLSLNSGNLVRTITVGNGSATVDAIISGTISSSNSLLKSGNGLLSLTANNTYSGGTTLQAGTLRVDHANALSTSGNITFTGGTLQYGSGISTDFSSRIKNSNATVLIDSNGESITFGSAIDSSNTGGLDKLGSGTLTFNSANTYTGGTTITAGTLQIGNGGTTGSLGSGSVTNNAQLTFNRSNNLTVSNAISGSGNVTITGGGAITLNGSNTYTGATTVQSGSLVVETSLASSSLTTVSSGGFLLGSGTVGHLVIASDGTINPGNSPGTITVGDTTWNGGGNYNWQLYNATGSAGVDWDQISSAGTLTIGATSGDKFKINLWSLSGISPDTNGTPINFNASSNYSWDIASFSNISGFSEDKFQIVTSATNGTGGFSGFTGTFSISSNGTVLTLNYTALAASAVWTAGSGNWSTGANWQSGSVPANDTPLEFVGAGGTSTNNDALTSVGGITFGSNATGSYTINGSALEIATGGILNNSTYSQTVATDLTLTVAQSFSAAAGNLTVTGAVDNNGHLLTASGNNTLLIQGAISGSAGLIQEDNGLLILSANNTYTGATTIESGTLRIGNGGTSGSLSASSAITNNGTLVFNRSDTLTQGTDFGSAAITGSGRLIQSGSGMLVLNAANSYTAGTTLQAGTLRAAHANALGTTGNITFTGGTLQYGTGITTDFSSRIKNSTSSMNIDTNGESVIFSSALDSSNSGGLTKLGNGTLTIGVANSYTGGTIINGGTIQIRNSSALGTTGTISFGGGTLLWGNVTTDLSSRFSTAVGQDFKLDLGSNNVTFSTAITSAGGTLTKDGSGLLRLAGAASTLSSITINSGTLRGGNNANTFGGAGSEIIMNGGALTFFTNSAANGNYTNNDLVIQGDASLVNANSGSTTSTYFVFGNLTIGSNTLTVAPTNAGGTSDATITISKTTTLSGDATFNITDRANNVLVLGDILESGGSRSLTKTGIGTLTLNGSASYTGTTTISAGTLRIGTGGSTGSLSSTSIVNNGAILVDRTGNLTLAADISGTGSLTKNGSGTLVLSGSSSYSSATTVNAGTLNAAHANALGSNSIVTVNGGSLLVTADDAINGKNLTLASANSSIAGLAFAGNYSGTIGSLTLSSDSIIDLGTGSVSAAFADIAMGAYNLSIYNWSGTTLWNGGTGNDTDRIYFGTGTYNLDNVRFYSGNVGSDSFLGTGFDLGFVPGLGDQIIPVPEPETWVAAALLALIAALRWKRVKNRSAIL